MSLTHEGRLFLSVGAANWNDLSPRVFCNSVTVHFGVEV